MWYLATILIAAVGFILGIFGCFTGSSNHNNKPVDPKINQPDDSIKKQLTREELIDRMKALADKKLPSVLSQGAMCYKVAMPSNRAEYVCPVCGEKTLYESYTGQFINEDLSFCRGVAKSLSALECRIDESSFCKHCSQNNSEEPSLCLITKYKGEDTENKVCGIGREDMVLLREFFDGSPVHRDDYDFETPLKDKMDQISRLLGVENPVKDKE